jgi:hypothetical protein
VPRWALPAVTVLAALTAIALALYLLLNSIVSIALSETTSRKL